MTCNLVARLAVSTAIARTRSHATTHNWSDARTRTGCHSRVGAEHADARAELRSSERNHVLANMGSNNLTMLRVCMSKDVLDEVVAILVAGNVNKRDPRAIQTSLTDSVKIAAEEVGATDLETLLDDLGSELIHRILSSVTNDMINGAASVRRGSMLANVLDAPVSELTVSDDVDVYEDLLNAMTL